MTRTNFPVPINLKRVKSTKYRMENYIVKKKLGEGANGIVYSGKCLTSGKHVALKRVFLRSVEDGLQLTALRELLALKYVRHPNVSKLLAILKASRLYPSSTTLLTSPRWFLLWNMLRRLSPKLFKALLRSAVKKSAILQNPFLRLFLLCMQSA